MELRSVINCRLQLAALSLCICESVALEPVDEMFVAVVVIILLRPYRHTMDGGVSDNKLSITNNLGQVIHT